MVPHHPIVGLVGLLLLLSLESADPAGPRSNYINSIAETWGLHGLTSPLSPSSTLTLLNLSRRGELRFCATKEEGARGYCAMGQEQRVRGSRFGSGVCILLLFDYQYRGETCYNGTNNNINQATILKYYSSVYFFPAALKVGDTMQLPTSESFDGSELSKLEPFLPYSIAKSLHFTPQNLQKLMAIYGVSQGSDMASSMQETLLQCSVAPALHEVRACHAALESMVSFVVSILGKEVIALKPNKLPAHDKTQIIKASYLNDEGSKLVSCHAMAFPSLIYSCHLAPNSRVIEVSMLQPANGVTTHGNLAICHLDTSYWDPSHIAFKTLETKPGRSSICHWVPPTSLIFVQKRPAY